MNFWHFSFFFFFFLFFQCVLKYFTLFRPFTICLFAMTRDRLCTRNSVPKTSNSSTSFPGSLFFPSRGASLSRSLAPRDGENRDPGDEKTVHDITIERCRVSWCLVYGSQKREPWEDLNLSLRKFSEKNTCLEKNKQVLVLAFQVTKCISPWQDTPLDICRVSYFRFTSPWGSVLSCVALVTYYLMHPVQLWKGSENIQVTIRPYLLIIPLWYTMHQRSTHPKHPLQISMKRTRIPLNVPVNISKLIGHPVEK